ncbi:hypothetical protein D6817_04960 [Candidatus Pacearchaeota archaeon]|nr:MAG: hypothetical protein D6817_04960 [Candidatus Pacearchaeota archaeon]
MGSADSSNKNLIRSDILLPPEGLIEWRGTIAVARVKRIVAKALAGVKWGGEGKIIGLSF